MKFTDGLWLHQSGVSAFYAAQVTEAVREGGELVLFVTAKVVKDRGQTIGGHVYTMRLSAPLPGAIAVRIEHHSGGTDREPRIPWQPQSANSPVITISETAVSIASGNLVASAEVRNGSWDLKFTSGDRLLTRCGDRGLAYATCADKGAYMLGRLDLGVGECVYGLGERFTAFVKNGQVVETVNKDGGTGSDQAYKTVPFYLTNRGYGVLVNHTAPVSFEVASEKVTRVQFSLPGERLEFVVFDGPTPREVLGRLTALTGHPALPPAWSFGLWLSTSFITNYDEATCTGFIESMRERSLPLHVFHFDCFWMREFHWCDFQWDRRTFPDPVGMLRRLHERGLRVCVWINPYIAQRSPLFDEGLRGDFLLKRPDGRIWQTDEWQPGMAIVDFTNPAARTWYTGYLRRLMDMGVDSFKTDFGERIPTDVVWHDGADPESMHNYYSLLYNETVFNTVESVRGRGEALLFARSAYASSQRFPVHWGGDCTANFTSMAESLRGGLSLAMCGFGFWSHDIGGFEGNGSAAVYKRWIAFGLLSSHSRLHGSWSYRVPWAYDDEACDVLRFFTTLKCRLMPYLYAKVVESHTQGVPMLRAMLLEFPYDPASDTLDRQYMLGDALLVAPVMNDEGTASHYLPEGLWTHLLNGEVVQGGRWLTTRHDFFSLPVYVRPGTILPFGANNQRPDYDFADDLTFRIYQLAPGVSATCSVPGLDGATVRTLTVTATADGLAVDLGGSHTGPWRLQLTGIEGVASVEGGTAQADAEGVIIVPNPGVRSLRLQTTS